VSLQARDLAPGWATDLAVLELTGSTIEPRDGHLVVRTPRNPDFHWGNCLFVTDPDAVDDAPRWVDTFRAGFPAAGWVAVGLVRMPGDVAAWEDQGLEVELDEVLTTRTRPRQVPLPDGYEARRLVGDDWEQYVARAVAENARTGEAEPEPFARFMAERMRVRRALSEQGTAAFFGAFADGRLVADLGIVRCGTTARYQSVSTSPEHRRRGLAAHLLGAAAGWAADRGCDRWVIVTESTNPAGRVYRGVGFEPDIGNAQAYRRRP
jgi:GNAT superfamily N-acetyltransferase